MPRRTDIFQILFQGFVLFAWAHAILAGLVTASFLVLGVSCWHLLRRSNVDVFRSSAKLAIVVALPVTFVQLGVGSEFGVAATDVQPMKIAATEALWDTEEPAAFSLFQIGGFTVDDQTPSFDVEVPGLLSFLATNSFKGQVVGINELQRQAEQQFGPGNYIPDVRLVYWSMRVMAYFGTLLLLLAAWGGWLLWRGRLDGAKWFQRAALAAIALPFLANFAGWILTEAGRQPWVVYGLLKTEDAVSGSVSAWTVGLSLGVFASLYVVLGALDFYLMRRYARLDPPDPRPGAARRRRRSRRLRTEMTSRSSGSACSVFLERATSCSEGFDFGVGILLPFLGRSEADRGTMFESIGPIWDGNEVWLVIAGGATFAAFPVWYATMFSGFYLALLLILALLIVRVLSFEWRGKAARSALEGVLGVDEHDRVDRRAVPVGHRAREPPPRRANRV